MSAVNPNSGNDGVATPPATPESSLVTIQNLLLIFVVTAAICGLGYISIAIIYFVTPQVVAAFDCLSSLSHSLFHFMHSCASTVIAAFGLISALHLIFHITHAIFVRTHTVQQQHSAVQGASAKRTPLAHDQAPAHAPPQHNQPSFMTSIRILVVSSAIIDDFSIFSFVRESLLTLLRMVQADPEVHWQLVTQYAQKQFPENMSASNAALLLILVAALIVIVPKRNFMIKFFILIACAAIINPAVRWQEVLQHIQTNHPEIMSAFDATFGSHSTLILIVAAVHVIYVPKRTSIAEALILIVTAATIGSLSTLHLFIVIAYTIIVSYRTIVTDICIHIVTFAITNPTVHKQYQTHHPEIMSAVDATFGSHCTLILTCILVFTAAMTFELHKLRFRTPRIHDDDNDHYPKFIVMDGSMNVVADFKGCLQVIQSSDGALLRTIGSPDLFHHPTSVAFHKDLIIVADRSNIESDAGMRGRVQLLGYSDGRLLLTIDGGNNAKANFLFPCSVAVDSEGNLLVRDANSIHVFRINDGTHVRRIRIQAGQGSGGIEFDRQGNVVVVDSSNHHVEVLRYSDGAHLRTFGNRQLLHPRGVLWDAGDIIVSDNHRLQVFNTDGSCIRTIGSEGTGDGQFRFPHSVVKYGVNIIVADSGNHRLQVLNMYGKHIKNILMPAIPAIMSRSEINLHLSLLFLCLAVAIWSCVDGL
jgi:hypothetical protein